MGFLDIAKKRFSVRSFLIKDVEEEKLLQVLEAARIAPSACNLQPWHLIVIRDPDLKAKVAEAYPRDWFINAPVFIVVCGDHSQSWKRSDGKDFSDIDLAIATDHMTLAATDLGLGACWIGAFDVGKCKKALQLPDYIEPVVLLPLGYPAKQESPERHQIRRKGLEDIVHWDKFTK